MNEDLIVALHNAVDLLESEGFRAFADKISALIERTELVRYGSMSPAEFGVFWGISAPSAGKADEQVAAALDAWFAAGGERNPADAMRAALDAADGRSVRRRPPKLLPG